MAGARVLIASGSAGHGHTMAARALEAALRLHPVAFELTHLDTVELMMRAYTHVYRRGYVRLVDQAPELWRALYALTNRNVNPITHALTRLSGRKFVQAVRRFRPDVVLCTHFLAPEILSSHIRKGKLDVQVHAVVTDHDAHRIWYWPEITRYYVASELVRARFSLQYGIPMDAIEVTGIPVRPEFTSPSDPASTRLRLGLDSARPTVVFLSGGFAAGQMARAIHGVWLERRDVQVVAICGRNERLRRRVARLARPAGAVLHPLGFVNDVAPMLSVADLVVAKSGGITVSECMAMGKPMVISGSIPGQEERNADAVVEAGAGVRALTPEEVRWRIARLLEDPQRLAEMAANAKAFGRPGAGQAIAESLVRQLEVSSPPSRPYFHGA